MAVKAKLYTENILSPRPKYKMYKITVTYSKTVDYFCNAEDAEQAKRFFNGSEIEFNIKEDDTDAGLREHDLKYKVKVARARIDENENLV